MSGRTSGYLLRGVLTLRATGLVVAELVLGLTKTAVGALEIAHVLFFQRIIITSSPLLHDSERLPMILIETFSDSLSRTSTLPVIVDSESPRAYRLAGCPRSVAGASSSMSCFTNSGGMMALRSVLAGVSCRFSRIISQTWPS